MANDHNYTGVPPDEYNTFRNGLIRKLEAVPDPKTGEPIINRILTKEEAYPGTHNRRSPKDPTLVMRDHSFISIANKIPVIMERPDVEVTHYPEGIFYSKRPWY